MIGMAFGLAMDTNHLDRACRRQRFITHYEQSKRAFTQWTLMTNL